MFGSIRFRMVVIYILVTVASLLATNMVVSVLLEESMVEQRTKSQLTDAGELARWIADELMV